MDGSNKWLCSRNCMLLLLLLLLFVVWFNNNMCTAMSRHRVQTLVNIASSWLVLAFWIRCCTRIVGMVLLLGGILLFLLCIVSVGVSVGASLR